MIPLDRNGQCRAEQAEARRSPLRCRSLGPPLSLGTGELALCPSSGSSLAVLAVAGLWGPGEASPGGSGGSSLRSTPRGRGDCELGSSLVSAVGGAYRMTGGPVGLHTPWPEPWFAGAAPPRLVPPLTREHPHQRCHARGHPRHGRVSLTCVATPRPGPGGFPRVGGVDRTAELNDGGGWADLGLLRNRRPDGSGLASRGAGIRHQCASHVPGPPRDMDCERPHLRGRGGCPPPRPLTLG